MPYPAWFLNSNIYKASIKLALQPSQILPQLWQGGINTFCCENTDEEASQVAFLKQNFCAKEGITHIVSVCDHHAPSEFHTQERLELTNVELDVDDTDLLTHMRTAVIFIHQARLNGGKVYVHCAMGVSRSSTITLAYLMTVLNQSFETCWAFLKSARSVASPISGFQEQLRVFGTVGGLRDKVREELLQMVGSRELISEDERLFAQFQKRSETQETLTRTHTTREGDVAKSA